MLRKLLAVVFLAAVAAGLWYGARWLRGRNDLRATIIFDDPVPSATGDRVLLDGETVGRVTAVSAVDGKSIVSVRIRSDKRKQVRADSRFSVDDTGVERVVSISSRFTFGKPLANDAVVHVRKRVVNDWLKEGTAAVKPFIDSLTQQVEKLKQRYGSGEFGKQLDSWKKSVPEWERQGSAVTKLKLAAIRRYVAMLEADLRGRKEDGKADELRKEFDEWWRELRAENSNVPPAPEEVPGTEGAQP